MAGYCTRADVIALLPSGGLPNPPRVAMAVATGDYLACDQHGLSANQPVEVRAELGGSLPAPLAPSTTYYAIVVSTSRFMLAATPGGPAIDLTSNGLNFVYTSEHPWEAWIEWGAREIDSYVGPHVQPIEPPYPQAVVTANAQLAGLYGLQQTAGAEIDFNSKLEQITSRLTRWAKGVPIRGEARSNQSPSNLAVTGKPATPPGGGSIP